MTADDHASAPPNRSTPAGVRGTALGAVAVAAVLFGTSGVARGLVQDGADAVHVSAVFVGAWRAFVGGLGLVIAAVVARQAPWSFPSRPGWSMLGGAAVIGYQLAFFAATDRVGVGPAAVVTIGSGPVVAGLVDRFVFRTAVPRRWLLGVATAIVGIVALSAGGAGETVPTGWAFALVAGACYPVYGLAAQRLMIDRPALAAIATVFGAGAVITLPIAVAASLSDSGPHIDAEIVLLVAYVGLVATALAYGLWAIGLHRLSLSDTVAVTLAEPTAAVLLSALLLDERLGARSVAAMVVILVGVVIATTMPAPSTRPSDRTG